jgi:hypothetical protein
MALMLGHEWQHIYRERASNGNAQLVVLQPRQAAYDVQYQTGDDVMRVMHPGNGL